MCAISPPKPSAPIVQAAAPPAPPAPEQPQKSPALSERDAALENANQNNAGRRIGRKALRIDLQGPAQTGHGIQVA